MEECWPELKFPEFVKKYRFIQNVPLGPKGTVSRDFRPFFCLKYSTWAHMNRRKNFRFREDIQWQNSKITCPRSQFFFRYGRFYIFKLLLFGL